jgi:hypothetical protein
MLLLLAWLCCWLTGCSSRCLLLLQLLLLACIWRLLTGCSRRLLLLLLLLWLLWPY